MYLRCYVMLCLLRNNESARNIFQFPLESQVHQVTVYLRFVQFVLFPL